MPLPDIVDDRDLLMDVTQLKTFLLRQFRYRCTRCDMTETEHLHRHGRSLLLVLIDPELPISTESFTALCVDCSRIRRPLACVA